jgi:hypothetical protein
MFKTSPPDKRGTLIGGVLITWKLVKGYEADVKQGTESGIY